MTPILSRALRWALPPAFGILESMPPEPERESPIERRIERSFEDPEVVGRPLSRRARQTRRSVEAYLKAGVLPRYMERLREIESEISDHVTRLDRAYRALGEEHAGDPSTFARRWRA